MIRRKQKVSIISLSKRPTVVVMIWIGAKAKMIAAHNAGAAPESSFKKRRRSIVVNAPIKGGASAINSSILTTTWKNFSKRRIIAAMKYSKVGGEITPQYPACDSDWSERQLRKEGDQESSSLYG